MKIALINPKSDFLTTHQLLQDLLAQAMAMGAGREFSISPNPSLLTIGALVPKDHDVVYIDEFHEKIPFHESFDMVALSAQTRFVKRAYEIAAEFKKRDIYTVLGGIHATLCPAEAGQHFDTVIVGEAEQLWPRFLDDFQNRAPNKFYRNPENYTSRLQLLPVPAYHLVKPQYYSNVAVLTQRGCQAGCTFCTIPPMYGKTVRRKSIATVIKEIETILTVWEKKPTIYFGDENFFFNKTYAKELIERIKPLKITWTTKATVDVCENEELLELAFDSGLRKIQIGFESISPQSLGVIGDHCRKQTFFGKYDHYKKAIEIIQRNCIIVVANFVFGFENEDISIFEKTKTFIFENNISASRLSFLVPFPGTPLFEKLKHEHRLLHEDWEKYTSFELVFRHPKMKKEEMMDALYKLIRDTNTPEHLAEVMGHIKKLLLDKRLRKSKRG